jgi:hypothetical protein
VLRVEILSAENQAERIWALQFLASTPQVTHLTAPPIGSLTGADRQVHSTELLNLLAQTCSPMCILASLETDFSLAPGSVWRLT